MKSVLVQNPVLKKAIEKKLIAFADDILITVADEKETVSLIRVIKSLEKQRFMLNKGKT